MLLTCIFKLFNVPLENEYFVSLKPTDRIYTGTLRRMWCIKLNGVWQKNLAFYGTVEYDDTDEEIAYDCGTNMPLTLVHDAAATVTIASSSARPTPSMQDIF